LLRVKNVYDSNDQLFSSEPVLSGFDALSRAAEVTGAVLSFIKQVTGRNRQLVPEASSGVNMVIAIQNATNTPTSNVLAGAGSVLNSMTSFYAMDQYAQRGDGLGAGAVWALEEPRATDNRYECRSYSWASLLPKRHDWLEEFAVNDATWRRAA
jgi:hypothetical protein